MRRSVVSLLCIVIVSLSAPSGSTPVQNTDIGVLRSATCPVDLPKGSDLGDRLEFGYITVPERHATPGGPVIQLAVARFRSASDDPKPDPLVLNTGGPGDSNLDLFVPLMAGPLAAC